MTLLTVNEDYYKYKLLFHRFYLINKIIGKPLSVSEEEFLKMFVEESLDMNKIFHYTEFLTYEFWLEIRKYKKEKINNVNKVIETFPNNYELILANIFKLIEKHEYNENCLAEFFTAAEIFKDRKEHLYLFSALQQSIAYKFGDYSGQHKNYLINFLNVTKRLFNKKCNDEIIFLIDENWFKFNFRIIFDYICNSEFQNSELDNGFRFLIETFDTYKWLDNKQKEKLSILADRNIFYKKHAEIDEKYLSEMMIKVIENNCIIA